MNLRRVATFAALAALVVAFAVSSLRAGNQTMDRFMLFNGVDYADSSEIASPWIPIEGATRILIRTWTPHLGFASNADSTKTDSITSWKTLFSDSLSFIGKDSLGTLVTRKSDIPNEEHYATFPVCADSLMLTDSAVDTTKLVGVFAVAKNKILRAPANGSGVWTEIYPLRAAFGGSLEASEGMLPMKYLRIRVVPKGRATAATGLATVPNKTTGLRKLRMDAYVIKQNQ